MSRLRTAPTKSALLNLRKQVRFLEDGHALLERKRELLTRLVYQHIKEYQELKRTAHTTVRKAYRWLGIAQLRMGDRSIAQATLGATPSTSMKVLPRRALGVQYPSVEATVVAPQPVGLLGTDPSFDEARQAFAHAAVHLAELAAVEMALYRLISEQRKAQKRVNALKYNIIPAYRKRIKQIAEALEEEERGTLFQIKRLREAGERNKQA
ncbi:MAG: V-type ATP synthase subunit D [Chromatiaceae bacterium]|jgi:V/A-type H+-transporting ATPase subunit D|nr:V-type ATP synthase subunit D [Chromatiaceae bacterium]